MGPALEGVATEEGLDLAKVDVDKFTDLSMEYNVSAIPTVMTFNNGIMVDQVVGLQSVEVIREFVKKHVRK